MSGTRRIYAGRSSFELRIGNNNAFVVHNVKALMFNNVKVCALALGQYTPKNVIRSETTPTKNYA